MSIIRKPGGKPRDIEHAVPVDLLAQLMRAEADVVAVIGLGLSRRADRCRESSAWSDRSRPRCAAARAAGRCRHRAWGAPLRSTPRCSCRRSANGTLRKVCVGSAWGGSYSWRPSVRGREISDTSMIEMPENQQPAYISFAAAHGVMQGMIAPFRMRRLRRPPGSGPASTSAKPRPASTDSDVVDDQDVAGEPLHLGRDVGIVLVEVEAMHAARVGLDEGDQLRVAPCRLMS